MFIPRQPLNISIPCIEVRPPISGVPGKNRKRKSPDQHLCGNYVISCCSFFIDSMMDGTQRKSSRAGTLVRSPSVQNQRFKEPIILSVQNSKEIVSIPKN